MSRMTFTCDASRVKQEEELLWGKYSFQVLVFEGLSSDAWTFLFFKRDLTQRWRGFLPRHLCYLKGNIFLKKKTECISNK